MLGIIIWQGRPRRALPEPLIIPDPSEPVLRQRPASKALVAGRKPIARVKVGGRSLDSTIALKRTARDVRDLLESEGWQAFVMTVPLGGNERQKLVGIEVHGEVPGLVESAAYLLRDKGYAVRHVFEPVPRVPDTQHDIEVWIGESVPA
jgi:hypothetical protein